MNNISFGAKVFLDSFATKNSHVRIDTNDVYLKTVDVNNISTQIVNKYTDQNIALLNVPIETASKVIDMLEDGDSLNCNFSGEPWYIIKKSSDVQKLNFFA